MFFVAFISLFQRRDFLSRTTANDPQVNDSDTVDTQLRINVHLTLFLNFFGENMCLILGPLLHLF